MPHINDASNASVNVRVDKFRAYRPAGQVQAKTNCSLCSCAGVITHGKGAIVTSGAVARMVPLTVPLHYELAGQGGADPHFQHSQTFSGKGWMGAPPNSMSGAAAIESTNQMQVDGLMNTARQALGLCRVFKFGDPSVKDKQQTMKECIAYMTSMGGKGCIFAVLSPTEGHWNFAHVVGGNVQFVDYQTDHPDLGGAPTAGAHFQLALGKGDGPDGSAGIVLAFMAQDHFAAGPATP